MIVPTPAGIFMVTEKEKKTPAPHFKIIDNPIVDKEHSNFLVVYYNPNESTEKLLTKIKKEKGEIIEKYENFNALVVSFLKEKKLDKTKKRLAKIKGVLHVQDNKNID
ncbi:MAG: hypothetical protein Q4C98_03675 [Capnocytophaga sp.]|nr:hypothetical protein [Capnocytophaga sp.]